MRTEIVKYTADGLTMDSHLFYDEHQQGPRPGILVFPEAFGLSEHAKSRAERLASLGFVALACDLHGNGGMVEGLPAVMAILGPMMADPSHTRARARGGYDALVARPEVDRQKLAAIGYCFGGTMALELARSGAAIAGVAGFHSGLGTARPQDAKDIKARVLVCIGADDPAIAPEQRAAFEAEMRAGGVDWQMHLYGGVVHSFTNPAAEKLGRPEFARYDAKSDARSWATLQSFLGEIFR